MQDIDLERTLVVLKKNEDNLKGMDGSMGENIIDRALQLSSDLEENDLSGSEDHEELEPCDSGKPKK